MAGPNHLWSGDWEQESTQATDDLAYRPAPQREAPAAPEPERGSWRRFTARQLATGSVALLVIAAVAVALVTTTGGSPKHASSTPATASAPPPSATGGAGLSQPPPTPVVTGPSATWLGMQIVTSPLGAVVNTVPGDSSGNTAGFEPGDVITGVGNDQIGSVRQIRTAVAKTPLGDRVQITISRGSSILTMAVTLRNRPTIQP